MNANPLHNPYVFISHHRIGDVKALSYSAVRDLFQRLSKKVGFKVTPHMLRHTHATELIRHGWDNSYVQTSAFEIFP